jgi:hypothetical protein
VLHEWMVASDELCNGHGGGEGREPVVEHHGRRWRGFRLSDDGSWGLEAFEVQPADPEHQSAITDKEWDDAQVDAEIPEGAHVDVGLGCRVQVGHDSARPACGVGKYRLLG